MGRGRLQGLPRKHPGHWHWFSGCIALALKSKLKDVNVTGTDVSEKAIKTASKNASVNNLYADFFVDDILNSKITRQFDIIVSNPPYVTESDKKVMERNVLEYEPEDALFVSDSEPLKYYRQICHLADKLLSERGRIYIEINEAFGNEVTSLFNEKGFSTTLKKDIRGKDRFVRADK